MDQFNYQILVSTSGETPRVNYLDPRLSNYNINLQPHYQATTTTKKSLKIDEEQDRIFIDKWLLEKGKFQINPYHFNTKKKSEITIHAAKASLKNCLEILEKLINTQEQLRDNVETMTSNEWKEKTLEIGNLRSDFDKIMSLFEDNVNLVALKCELKKRLKKRANQKQRKVFQREFQRERRKKMLETHKNIDRWLEIQKEEVERVKTEERMKKDADCVLYEVTKKKSEARKQLSLISSLVKLRNVRDSMATQRGERLSLEDRHAFGKVTEKLIRMWENNYQKYCKEEQNLQKMLEDNAEKDSEAAVFAKERHIVAEWEQLLFGDKKGEHLNNPTYWALTTAERDLETFIAIRKSWDTFLVKGNTAGSRIPVGWVIPVSNLDKPWGHYIRHSN